MVGLIFVGDVASVVFVLACAMAAPPSQEPARSPPACRLVWPGQTTTTPLLNAPLNPATR